MWPAGMVTLTPVWTGMAAADLLRSNDGPAQLGDRAKEVSCPCVGEFDKTAPASSDAEGYPNG